MLLLKMHLLLILFNLYIILNLLKRQHINLL